MVLFVPDLPLIAIEALPHEHIHNFPLQPLQRIRIRSRLFTLPRSGLFTLPRYRPTRMIYNSPHLPLLLKYTGFQDLVNRCLHVGISTAIAWKCKTTGWGDILEMRDERRTSHALITELVKIRW